MAKNPVDRIAVDDEGPRRGVLHRVVDRPPPNRTDADLTDVKYMTSEIDHVLAHLRQWMKPLAVSTPLVLAPSHTQVQFDPLGVGLIIGTWNYPVMMVLSPLVSAISGGERGCYQAIGSISSHRRSDRTAHPRVSGLQRVFSSPRRGTRDYGTTGAAMGPHLFYRWPGRRQGGHDRGSETFDPSRARTGREESHSSCTPQPTCASWRTASPMGAGLIPARRARRRTMSSCSRTLPRHF